MVTNHSLTKISSVPAKRKRKIISISTEALVEMLSTEAANENVTQRYKERTEEVNPDYQNEDPITSAAGYRAVASEAKS
ncbi:hypothetical protein NPIL_344581 [Nephila pilipes]|uniref:RED-like N-terminal domain-containing protein n=1 Tax=Nephila pilipes TaxID=299642 RepID=A0A8X6MX31_NEPPI|nr:hypothetical protein NPIL_344581 [Nephila pilipes]